MLALFIILVSLTMTLFSEKVLISNRCISGLMSNLIKKILDGLYSSPKTKWSQTTTPQGHKKCPLFLTDCPQLAKLFFLSCPSGFSKIEHKRLLENQWHCNFLLIRVESIHFRVEFLCVEEKNNVLLSLIWITFFSKKIQQK